MHAQSSTEDTPARPPAAAPADSDIITLDEVRIVTGSHIRRDVDNESVLPVTALNFSDLEALDATSAADLFQYLPEVGQADISEESIGSADARGDVASVNLRGVGSEYSLILLNGRRLAAHPISQANLNRRPSLSVNINTLPTQILERLEILRDGASATYGADAIAGVVNYITRTDYNRTQMSARFSFTERSGKGGDSDRFIVSRGTTFNNGRSYFAWTYERFSQNRLMRGEREISANEDQRMHMPAPWDGQSYEFTDPATGLIATYRDNDFDGRSVNSPYGYWIVMGGPPGPDGNPTPNRPSHLIGFSNLLVTAGGLEARASVRAGSAGRFYITPVGNSNTSPAVPVGVGFLAGAQANQLNQPQRATVEMGHDNGAQSDFYFNRNPYRHLIPGRVRNTFYGIWTHKFNNGIEAFGDILAYDNESWAYQDPVYVTQTADPGIYVPASNWWNPFGERFYTTQPHPTIPGRGAPHPLDPTQTPRLLAAPMDVQFGIGQGVRLVDFGGRVAQVNMNGARFVSGLRGNIFDNWRWESALNYSFSKARDRSYNNVRESRFMESLMKTGPESYNPFHREFMIENGYIVVKYDTVEVPDPNNPGSTITTRVYNDYVNPPEVTEPLKDVYERNAKTTIFTWDARMDGELFSNWAGSVRGAAGAEFRYETFHDWRPEWHGLNPDSALTDYSHVFGDDRKYIPAGSEDRSRDNDFLGISPDEDIKSNRNVMAVFGEVLVPLVHQRQRIPLVRSLTMNASFRYETFTKYGDAWLPKLGLEWRPVSWLLFRGSYNKSFRTPNLAQEFETDLVRISSSVEDYYRQFSNDWGNFANFQDSASLDRQIRRGGSDSLSPETSSNVVVGAVFELPFLRNVTFTIDHYRLKMKDVLDAPTAVEIMEMDEALLGAWTREQLAMGRTAAQLTPYDSEGRYMGHPSAHRAVLSPTDPDRVAFLSWNSAPRPQSAWKTPVGAIEYIEQNYRNYAAEHVFGYDMAAQWHSEKSRFGRFDMRVAANYTSKRERLVLENAPWEDRRWRNQFPKWRGALVGGWNIGNWRFTVSGTYLGSSLQTNAHMGAVSVSTENMLARWDALGNPTYIVPTERFIRTAESTPGARSPWRFYYKVPSVAYYNFSARYSFRQGLLKGSHIRVGVLNAFDTDPSRADTSTNVRGAASFLIGRTFNIEFSRRF